MALIRQQVLDAIETKLEAITKSNGYSRNVGSSRVFEARKAPQQLPTPSILILQGDEFVDNSIGDRYVCTLPISIGFVDAYSGQEPDAEAMEFMADIQKAMGAEFALTVTMYSGGTGSLTVQMLEEGNAINSADALPGRIYGDVEYRVVYNRNILDPSKL
jgi:hypothetical protein